MATTGSAPELCKTSRDFSLPEVARGRSLEAQKLKLGFANLL